MTSRSAERHAAEITRLQLLGLLAGRRQWRRVDPDFISESWRVHEGPLVREVAALQGRAAISASEYGAAALAEVGLYRAPEAFVDPAAFTRSTPDGRTLDGLLYRPAVEAKIRIGGGEPPRNALAKAGKSLDRMIRSTIADAARQAAQVDIATRPSTGYIRVIVGETCRDCIVLAGKFYRWNQGFLRHPSCFPAGVTVSGPLPEGATRRWYEGELVIIHTASGKRLPATGNHPILTNKGWVPANLLDVGDSVITSTLAQGARPLVVPDEQQRPSLIEDVWGSGGMVSLGGVPTTAQDFHGDGGHGDVDVVLADRLLHHGGMPGANERIMEHLFAGGLDAGELLHGERSLRALLNRGAPPTGGAVGTNGLLAPVLGAHARGAGESSFGVAANVHAMLLEPAANHVSTHAHPVGDGVLRLAPEVGLGYGVGVERNLSPRWDAPAAEFATEAGLGYATRGKDLLHRLEGQVEADRVVELERVSWSGHVYNLTSVEGWYEANGLIVSNCDCIHQPITEKLSPEHVSDPYEHFQSLTRQEQDALWGEADAQALRDGADVYRVYNAQRNRRGASKLTTAEGTHAKRGFHTGRRLTPDGIYKIASDREEALRLLAQHGYILPGGQTPGGSILGRFRESFGGEQGGLAFARQTSSSRLRARDDRAAAVQRARRTGVRDPLNPDTMTAAERRLWRVEGDWEKVRQGINPRRRDGKNLTPEIAARVEKDYRRWLRTGGEVFT